MQYIKSEELPFPKTIPNEMRAELVGLPGVSAYALNVTGPRSAMLLKHLSQRPTLLKYDPQRIQTGVAQEMGKYTFSIKIPANSTIVALLRRINPDAQSTVTRNPTTTVIFVDEETRTIDYVDMVSHHVKHTHFGFMYKYNKDAMRQVAVGNHIVQDLVVADTPAKTDDGEYQLGLHANIALMTLPPVIEDGIMMSESFAKRLAYDTIEERTIKIDNNTVLLNMYGDNKTFKAFPDIGDVIRPDGAIIGMRKFSSISAPAALSRHSLRQLTDYDKAIYGQAGATIIDVQVIKGDTSRNMLSEQMDYQLKRYHRAHLDYCNRVLDEHKRLMRQSRGSYKLSDRFHRLVVECTAFTNTKEINLSYREQPRLNGWLLVIKYRKSHIFKRGSKITNTMGGKGVSCAIVPDSEMPTNDIGITADMIMDPASPANRSIPGAHIEIYHNAAGDMVRYNVKQMLAANEPIDKVFDYVLGFYKVCAPDTYHAMIQPHIDKKRHLDYIVQEHVGLLKPIDSDVSHVDTIKLIDKFYPPCKGPVTFKNANGTTRRSKRPVLIGGCCIILLDKTTVESSAVSSAKIQHYGLPAPLSRNSRVQSPFRGQPTKAIAEDELRLIEAVVGGKAAADLLDQSTNPDTHKMVLEAIYSTDKPSSVYRIVDRDKLPTGHGYFQEMVKNVNRCAGLMIVPSDDD